MTLSPAAQRRIDALRRDNPTFDPWLAVLEAALTAAADPAWEAVAQAATLVDAAADRPALEGATFTVDAGLAAGFVVRLLETASAAEGLGVLRAAARDADPGQWIAAAVGGDRAAVDAVAARIDAAPEAVAPVVELCALPLLFAAGKRVGAASDAWTHGHCPTCGNWATIAELRGLDRARRLRCGRCGADWGLNPLLCTYCGNDDHKKLTALVPEKNSESQRVDACHECRGYLKAVAQLRPLPAELLPLEDLGTVELDLVALERDYHRPDDVRRARAKVLVR